MGRDNRFYDKEEETGEKEGKKEWELEEEKENNMALQVLSNSVNSKQAVFLPYVVNSELYLV